MPNIPGLRSCYDKVGRLIYFGRMLDKIRLYTAGQLPQDYQAKLGDEQFFTLDGRCCRFLGVPYSEIKSRTLAGEADESVLTWAQAHGTPRTDEECHVWNRFIAKLGGRDERSQIRGDRPRSATDIGQRHAGAQMGEEVSRRVRRGSPTVAAQHCRMVAVGIGRRG